jgi:hypothetical protein
VDVGDARRTVRADLLAHREMQSHVQEGIRFAAVGYVIAHQSLRPGLERRVVLRVQLDDGDDLRLQGLEWQPREVSLPGLGIHGAQPFAPQVVKERHCCQLPTRAMAAAGVLWRYSQRSAVGQIGQSGLRALHT